MLPPEPQNYALYRTQSPRVLMIRNDVGEEFHFTKDFAGDLAIMLADHEPDADKADFVSEQWQGRVYELTEDFEDDYNTDEV